MTALQTIAISQYSCADRSVKRAVRHRFLCVILLAVLTFLTFSASANAQIFGSVSGGFSCSAGGGGGQLLNSGGQCPSSYEDGKIFSYFVCQIEKLISEVFGEFYCQLQTKLIDPMTAVITLAVVLFGIAFTIGIVPATAKDSMLFLFKVAVVWGFATQADLMIGVGYNFFMGGLKEGIAIVVGAIFQPDSGVSGFSPSGQGGQQIYEYMDTIFKKIITLTTESAGKGETGAGAGGDQNFCKNAIFGALTLLLVAFPPLFIMGVFFLFKFVLFFLRAVLGYIYAVMGISFLVCIAPIFLSFYFWRATQQYFFRWLALLGGFAIQMVVIFAFISFVLSMNASSVGKDLLALVVPYNKSVEAPGVRWPWKVCTICDFEIVDSNGNVVSGGGGNVPPTGSVRCKDNPGKPLNPGTLAGAPKTDDAGGGAAASGDMRNTLLKLATKVILTMLVLMQVVLALFDVVPQMAAQLASSRTLLVNNRDPLPGEQQITKAVEAFGENIGSGQSITAASEAFKEQSKLAFKSWLSNPV